LRRFKKILESPHVVSYRELFYELRVAQASSPASVSGVPAPIPETCGPPSLKLWRAGPPIRLKHFACVREPSVVVIQKAFRFRAAQPQQFGKSPKRNLLRQVSLQNERFQNAPGKLGLAAQSLGDFIR
jgi:hypothetical protein